MCFLCFRNNDYSIDHLESEVRKIKKADLIGQASSVKKALKTYEVWLQHDHLDGFERAAIEQTVENLKQVQYALSREM